MEAGAETQQTGETTVSESEAQQIATLAQVNPKSITNSNIIFISILNLL